MENKKILDRESVVTLAALQYNCPLGQREENIRKSVEMINKAADKGATMITLPEMCNTGYVFNNREEFYAVAENIPDGPSCKAWIKVARERNLHICAGMGELGEDGVSLYNSAVLIGPKGFIGKHRKLHLWDNDKYFMEPGDLKYQVFQTPIGRISMMICFDMWFMEGFRILANMGADLICIPTNWVDGIHELHTLGPTLALVNSSCNNIFIVCADRIGEERGIVFPGLSCIVGPEGWYRAGPASLDKEEILLAEVNLPQARRLNWNAMNVVHRDRRTDLYDPMLGSGLPRFPR